MVSGWHWVRRASSPILSDSIRGLDLKVTSGFPLYACRAGSARAGRRGSVPPRTAHAARNPVRHAPRTAAGPRNASPMSRSHQHHAGHRHGAHRDERGAVPAAGGGRRLLMALAILGTFTLVEAVGGYLANSIALLAEAAHMLADSASLLLAVLAVRVGQRPANER